MGTGAEHAALNWECAWPAPAKINLFLHVVGRRDDGYHLLQTVFRFLDTGDELRFSPRNDSDVVMATALPGVMPEDNLVVRAARALQAAAGVTQGAMIALEKRLPMGGGLGGGSSDAATTLLALNHLWRCGLSRPQLAELGLRLGADVPVFIHGRSAFGEGVGEKLRDVALPPAWYLVVVPPVAVSTAQIFSAPELRRDTAPIAADDWQPDMGHNDLEVVTAVRYPEVARHLAWLRSLAGSTRVAMSGSGACCFAEFAQGTAARAALTGLPHGMQGFVARGIDVHPLADV